MQTAFGCFVVIKSMATSIEDLACCISCFEVEEEVDEAVVLAFRRRRRARSVCIR